MKQIIINDHNLENSDMDYSVERVKGLIVNSRGEVILVQNNNTFQFPGGHKRKNETLNEGLIRELREELGVNLEVDSEPFMLITTYDNNYFDSGSRVLSKIYYYLIKSDVEPDLDKLMLDAMEKETDFNILKVRFSELDIFLNKCLEDGTIDSGIGREMLLVCASVYEMFGGIL